ncbi:LysR family transcriptional regulator [Pseudoduganella sp. OTU4001]|uniref:LysR family transcriptional regulator n=1 Tax=Pseudoduganella sp. OTU4001 TaxID=3043854 RepID=UPI00313B716D
MDLRKLRHIIALFEEGSFVKAAQRVHLTQPALSRSVQALEADLGVSLFDRTRDGVHATAAGRQFVERARAIERSLSVFQHDMRQLHTGVAGEVAFGVGPFPAFSALEPALQAITRDYPQLRLRVEIQNAPALAGHLKAERIEFFLADVRLLKHDAELRINPVGIHPGLLCCRAGHPLAGAKKAGRRELQHYGFVSVHLPPTSAMPPALLELIEEVDGKRPQMLACDHVDLLKHLALQSDRLLLTTRSTVEAELASGALVELPIPALAEAGIELGLVTLRERTLSAAAEVVIAQLVK